MKKILAALALWCGLLAFAQMALLSPAATPLPPGIKVEATPALWQIKSVRGTVYLNQQYQALHGSRQASTRKNQAGLFPKRFRLERLPDVLPGWTI